MKIYELAQLVCDPENQPHQFIDDPDGFIKLLSTLETTPEMDAAGLNYLNRRGTGWYVGDLFRHMAGGVLGKAK